MLIIDVIAAARDENSLAPASGNYQLEALTVRRNDAKIVIIGRRCVGCIEQIYVITRPNKHGELSSQIRAAHFVGVGEHLHYAGLCPRNDIRFWNVAGGG
jgi:hypothetical protein